MRLLNAYDLLLFPGKKIGPDFGCDPYPGPILESKDMHAIFQKKGKKT